MSLQGREISKKSYLLSRGLPKVFGIKVRYLVSSCLWNSLPSFVMQI